MSQDPTLVEVLETSVFIRRSQHHLGENELYALRTYLATNPYAGEPSEEYPGVLVLDWDPRRALTIHYLVLTQPKRIYLVWIDTASSKLPSPESQDGREASGILKVIAQLGIGISARELWKLLRDHWFI
jgi:hypothetical protein